MGAESADSTAAKLVVTWEGVWGNSQRMCNLRSKQQRRMNRPLGSPHLYPKKGICLFTKKPLAHLKADEAVHIDNSSKI
jgi:hypothetical protein